VDIERMRKECKKYRNKGRESKEEEKGKQGSQ
jgi:hypothetical protein